MKIESKYLGQVEVDEDSIINFPQGILGFEENKRFVILDIEDNPSFKFLQNLENRNCAFLIINPWEFFPDYDIDVKDTELEKIAIEKGEEENILLYTIVTIGENFKDSTTNLLAPIIVNAKDKKGIQYIIEKSLYGTKHQIFPQEIKKNVSIK